MAWVALLVVEDLVAEVSPVDFPAAADPAVDFPDVEAALAALAVAEDLLAGQVLLWVAACITAAQVEGFSKDCF